jgi:hypothetical protein
MNLLDLITQAQGGGAVSQMAERFGIPEDQAQSAIGAVLPMLAGAMQQNVQSGGLDGLLSALQGGGHQKYLDDPSALNSPEAVQDGNGILGHLLGSKEVSRQVASHAAAESGVSSDIIKQMLPLVAGLLMGGLSRQASASALAPQQPSAADGILGMLGPLLGQNQNSSALSTVLGLAGQFFGRR